MKQFTHRLSTWQKSSKPLLGLLIIFSAWGNSNQAFAATTEAAIPQSSLFDVISARAKKLASEEYIAPKNIELDALNNIDYQDYRSIRFKQDKSVWKDEGLYELQLFHPGFLYKTPVTINTVNSDSKRTRLPFSTDFYQYDGTAAPLKEEITKSIANTQLGHAGFRLHYPLNTNEYKDEVMVFQGASYFRIVGPKQVYGLSARGLAIDTAEASGEEFPMFKEFWLVKPKLDQTNIVMFALLDSPSVSGAYRFDVDPTTNTAVKVNMQIFARKDVKKLGIAPLTSMFYHGENSTKFFDDYRPEVHDSDGLLTQSQDNKWVWRPLNNPAQLSVTSFTYENPKGFGLAQRDRDFNNYFDTEAHYHDRPSLWIEPEGEWGNGRVELVEIPTDTETNDNIVSYWVPEKPFKAGDSLKLSYKMTTFNAHLNQHEKARVVRTRIGSAALPGEDNPPPKSHRQFTVDFSGPELNQLSKKLDLKADIQLTTGEVSDVTIQKLPDTYGWRVAFKIAPQDGKPVDMRLSLKLREKEISEVWSYVWYPNDIK
ncbi:MULTISPECIES: glucan biosynthesis protein G [Pseudoalteromonas]|uniref:glucan biosynthesis protein G n=1 Tax=Pseudoalteromonas TaxID=53246 RepID=UPI00023157BF|nr:MULTISPECIES: glucan biosynthesis protein G [unclassified Pseudoalteromonas]ALQ09611.1 glucan biosynthesis protein D [Pseudoalteromonas sp. Bsw20308]KDC54960.1 glucan biosynthesis protein D [Pseudoalteromonas sp. S3431]MDQ2045140.1 glucan biosynthesis protein G [Pseudoalteromonas sp. 20-92]GAA79861.1 glucans biosynthesis protein G [Pseudoalteromonas sp. BSi20495]